MKYKARSICKCRIRRIVTLRVSKKHAKNVVILVLATVAGWYLFWFGLSAVLQTPNPIVFVGLDPGLPWDECSMSPTLNPGDMLLLQGVPARAIAVGNIIVFRSPINPNELIVHRVVEILFRDGNYYFTTKGDNSRTNPWSLSYEREFPSTYMVGRVILRVPFIGWGWILAKTPTGKAILIGCVIVLIVLEIRRRDDIGERLYLLTWRRKFDLT